MDTDDLYRAVLEKLRAKGGVVDDGLHFTWEPAERNGVPYQHIRWGPWGIADTYCSPGIPEIPESPFLGSVPARVGDIQVANLIVALLNDYPSLRDRIAELEGAIEILSADEIISAGRARELHGMTIDQQRQYWRDLYKEARQPERLAEEG